MSLFARTMTPDECDRLIQRARIRRAEREARGGWIRHHLQWQINNFRPATPAKPEDVSCVVSTSDAAARVERQGGATSASPSGDSVRGNATA